MPKGDTVDEPTHRDAGGRRLSRFRAVGGPRVAGVSTLVLLIALAGAGALWIYTRASDPAPAPPGTGRTTAQPPVRLDTLPLARSPERPLAPRRSSDSGRAEESSGRAAEEGQADEGPSKADIRRELAALAGENAAIAAALSGDRGPGSGTGEVVDPVRGRTIARFGRALGPKHNGIDIDAPAGTPVHAADSGRVVISGVTGGYGKYICIQHTGTLSTCYAHNSQLRVKEGESVDSGDVISLSGCSGRCYGDHLHFEVRERGRAVNPRDYL